MFESLHLRDADFDRAALLLNSHGFEYVSGYYKNYFNVWHHVNSSAELLAH